MSVAHSGPTDDALISKDACIDLEEDVLVEACGLPPAGRVPCRTPSNTSNALPIAGDNVLGAELDICAVDVIVEPADVDIEYRFACRCKRHRGAFDIVRTEVLVKVFKSKPSE